VLGLLEMVAVRVMAAAEVEEVALEVKVNRSSAVLVQNWFGNEFGNFDPLFKPIGNLFIC
jgi:hypothetical protein